MQAKILNPKITAGYRVNLASAGYIGPVENDGVTRFGWRVEDQDALAPSAYGHGRYLVVVTTDCVFIGSDLAETLGVDIDWGTSELHLGRKTLWAISPKDLAGGLEHNAYPPRNERESEVRRRNVEVINWLAGLLEGVMGRLALPSAMRSVAMAA